VRIRLRTQNGDLGPLQQTASETVGDVKRRLVADWSKLIADASITSAEAPTAITDVKLILNGKFLDNDESLGGTSTFSPYSAVFQIPITAARCMGGCPRAGFDSLLRMDSPNKLTGCALHWLCWSQFLS